ncbi:hypothetical protein D3C81_244610 [compost metagenome]
MIAGLTEQQNMMLQRVADAGVTMGTMEQKHYVISPDDLGEVEKGTAIVRQGYKRCGACGHVLKFYLFNKNSSSKTNTSGSCKECQKQKAAGSYKRTKKRRNYKKYYQENKDIKQAHARKYYQDNKDIVTARHKEYLQTKAGKKVMQKAHAKRRDSLSTNKGIPYTRAMIIERDGVFIDATQPVCYICAQPILDISGAGLHIDHLVPVVMGGLDCLTNVACTHNLCNLQREKDARELTTDQVELIITRSEAFMDKYPDKFI